MTRARAGDRAPRAVSALRGTLVAALAGLALLLSPPCRATAQEPSVAPPARGVPERALIVVDSAAHLVGGAIRVPQGSAYDPEGEEGAATVLALALDRVLSGVLAGTSVSASVSVDRAAITVTFLADPSEWASATARILESVFAPPPRVVLEQARADHLQRLRFEAGAPVREFRELRYAVLFGGGSAWARPSRGTVDSVLRIDLGTLGTRLGGAGREAAAFAALVGPVDAGQAETLLDRFRGAAADRPAASALAWADGFTERFPVEITSTWVTVAFPAPADVPRHRLELLAHHVREYLSPVPVRPGLVDQQVELLEAPGGPVLFITFAVAPEAAERWTLRVTEVVRLERDAPPDERFFAWERRRFRVAWRQARAEPDARAEALVRARSARAPVADTIAFAGLGIADLRAVAASLGPARTFLYGPDLAGREAGR